MATSLEFRIAQKHAEKQKFDALNSKIHALNPVWSYARHLPHDWDQKKIQRRTDVARRLRDNLLETLDIPSQTKDRLKGIAPGRPIAASMPYFEISVNGPKRKIDLSPLKDDVRASGFIYGPNPILAGYELIKKLAAEHPDYPFFGKWGGYDDKKEGKRMVFYCDDLDGALLLSERLYSIANRDGIKVAFAPAYGIDTYKRFIHIDQAFESKVRDVAGFLELLIGIQGVTHFRHDLFVPEGMSR